MSEKTIQSLQLSLKDFLVAQDLGGTDLYEEKPDDIHDTHYSDKAAHRERGIANRARQKALMLLGAVAIELIGCSAAITVNEQLILYGNDSGQNSAVVAHEQRHQWQMQQVGGATIFWSRYLTDGNFRCKAELDASMMFENNLACFGQPYNQWSQEVIQEPFLK